MRHALSIARRIARDKARQTLPIQRPDAACYPELKGVAAIIVDNVTTWKRDGPEGEVRARDRTRELALLGLLGAFGLAFGLAWESIRLKSALLVALGAFGLGVFAVPYRWALFSLLLWVGVEGFAKLLSNYNPVVHVGSDLLVVTLAARVGVGLLLRRIELPRLWPPLLVVFALHFGWYAVEFFNPYSIGIDASLASAKMYVTMVLLYFFGFYATRTKGDLHLYMAAWAAIGALQIAATLYQSAAGPASVLSLGSQFGAALAKYRGQAFRPFGLTSQPGAPSVYVVMALPVFLYLLGTTRSWLLRAVALAALPLSVLAILVCQVRSALVRVIVEIGGFLLLMFVSMRGWGRARAMGALLVAAAVLAVALPHLTTRWIEHQTENRQGIERTLTVIYDFQVALQSREGKVRQILSTAERVPLGAGHARSGAAAGKYWDRVMNHPVLPGAFFADNVWVALIAEIGIPGALIYSLLLFGVVWHGFRQRRLLTDPGLRAANAALLPMLVACIGAGWGAETVLYNPDAAIFWFFSGCLLKLPALDQERR